MPAKAEVLSPAADIPVLGDLIGLLDGAAQQAGMPFWLRALAELVVAGVLAYLLLRLLTTRVLPWVGNALVRPAVMITRAATVLLLLPDLGIASAVRRFGRTPPEFVYGYGTAVAVAADTLEELARRGLPKIALVRLVRPWLLVAALVVLFLLWNNQYCAGDAAPKCVSPVQVWLASTELQK